MKNVKLEVIFVFHYNFIFLNNKLNGVSPKACLFYQFKYKVSPLFANSK